MYTNLAAFVSSEVFSNVLRRPYGLHRIGVFVPRGDRDELVEVQTAVFDHFAKRPEPENPMVPSTSRQEGEDTVNIILKDDQR